MTSLDELEKRYGMAPEGAPSRADEIEAKYGLSSPPAPAATAPKLQPGPQPLTAEQKASIARSTKAGLVPEGGYLSLGSLKAAADPSAIATDLGAYGAAANDVYGFGIPNKLMDVAGLSSPEERERLRQASPVGDFAGRVGGQALDMAGGAGKAISDVVSSVGEKVGQKVTTEAGKKFIGGALLPAAEATVGGATYGGGQAASEGKPFKSVVENAQDYGTGALLLHGAFKAGGAIVGESGEMAASRQATKDKAAAAAADQATIADLTNRASPKAKDRVAGNTSNALRVARENGLVETLKDPVVSKKAHEAAIKRLNGANTEAYKAVEDTGARVKTPELTTELNKVQEGMRGTTAGDDAADAVHRYMQKIWETYGGAKGKLTASQLRAEITELRKGGFPESGMAPPKAAAIQRKVADALEESLDKHLDVVAKANPGLVDRVGAIKQSNKDLSLLIDLDKAAGKRAVAATLAGPQPKPTVKELMLDYAKQASEGGKLKRYVVRPTAAVARGADALGTKAMATFALKVREASSSAGADGMTVPALMDYAKRLGIQQNVARDFINGVMKPPSDDQGQRGDGSWQVERQRLLDEASSS